MSTNFPGPYEVRFNYSVTLNSLLLNHQQKLSLVLDGDPDPGDAFSTIPAFLANGLTTAFLDDLVELWTDHAVVIYSNNANQGTWSGAELWKYETQSYNAQFISAYSFSKAGTSGSAAQEAAQSIVTFRSTLGGIMKLSFMESVIIPGSIDPLPFNSAGLDTIADNMVLGNVYPWIARDQGWPFACLQHFPGQNEAVWKKRRRAAI